MSLRAPPARPGAADQGRAALDWLATNRATLRHAVAAGGIGPADPDFDDALQEAAVAVWKGWGTYRPTGTTRGTRKAWAATVARHAAESLLRKRTRRREWDARAAHALQAAEGGQQRATEGRGGWRPLRSVAGATAQEARPTEWAALRAVAAEGFAALALAPVRHAPAAPWAPPGSGELFRTYSCLTCQGAFPTWAAFRGHRQQGCPGVRLSPVEAAPTAHARRMRGYRLREKAGGRESPLPEVSPGLEAAA